MGDNNDKTEDNQSDRDTDPKSDPTSIELDKCLTEQLKSISLNVCRLKTKLQYPDFISKIGNYDIICVYYL